MQYDLDTGNIPLQPLKTTWLFSHQVEAAMLRLDLIHPEVSGNKWFKLKYNLEEAYLQGKDTILTFGGARSNHIVATAAATKLFGFKSIGMIRGDALQAENPTLLQAVKNGMRLHFIHREAYRHKAEDHFLRDLHNQYPGAYIIPEGGNNGLGMKGAEDILSLIDVNGFTHICCPVGTGTTLAGIIATAQSNQKVIGFSALKKADDQRELIKKYLSGKQHPASWRILTDYQFGGFARRNRLLDEYMDTFYKESNIPLDFVYTAKMVFGIQQLVDKNYFPAGSRLLIIHTGGLQGNRIK